MFNETSLRARDNGAANRHPRVGGRFASHNHADQPDITRPGFYFVRACGLFATLLRLKGVVVAANGKDIDMRIVKSINKPIFLTEAPRPKACKVMSQGFGFTQAGRRISAQHFLNNCAEVLVHLLIPLPQILVHFPRFSFKY